MKFFQLLALLSLGLVYSVTPADAKVLSQNYINFVTCVDVKAAANLYDGLAADKALSKGISQCGRELNRYVDELIKNTKRRNNWKSVQPEVRPEVTKNVVNNTYKMMLPAYKKHKK